ncbi:pyridine nucleotide-disulfide oxidoreductase [Candidatus Epulonipiscium fishelsonii]|uniref:Pyridine nucleotide-disulfide oxidoreductase n=1 Tax=Candidatus Epulonipiscium fishelsonii TaxID=77094 RepID=A0ACC8XDI8_9FIRM|nr:pyridine nucleotide-disulfide oxidoreductase [Epulopiscium sp. SCG-D08WGA-EpuloA1]
MREVELVVIGGGPAGLAAAVKAYELGLRDILIIERDVELGGILQQCIHDGFGLHRFGKQLSGSAYAQKFIDKVEEYNIPVYCNTMVLEITKDKKVVAVSPKEGLVQIQAKAIVLAMGCRERTRSQVRILGTRPAGVMTAGAVQRYINVEGWKTGTRAVILGSGDIGLIMARRMTLEGILVEGVYEVMPNLGGLRRNKAQCLDDYNIPLYLATTVVSVHGKQRVDGVTVAKVGSDRLPIEGTERYIPCDLLVLSVGLIPENELSRNAGLELHPITKGPVVDTTMMSSVDGIFVAGNVGAVFDLVDYVSLTGEIAAQGAVSYLEGKRISSDVKEVIAGENVSFVFPQNFYIKDNKEKATLYMRVRKTMQKVRVEVSCNGEVIATKKERFATPPEMISIDIPTNKIVDGELKISVLE